MNPFRDVRVGDWITDTFCSSDRHGPVAAITAYRCGAGPTGHGCDPATCERAAWRVLVYRDGTEVSMTPGAWWPGARIIRDGAR